MKQQENLFNHDQIRERIMQFSREEVWLPCADVNDIQRIFHQLWVGKAKINVGILQDEYYELNTSVLISSLLETGFFNFGVVLRF